MKRSSAPVQHEGKPLVQAGEPADVAGSVHELFDRIAYRAREIYEENGRLGGHDLANWCQAETEFLHPLRINIFESPEALILFAEVPGFKLSNLKINVEPRRVTISGKREFADEFKAYETVYSEVHSDQVLRVADLPAIVDAERAEVHLRDGMLKLHMPKAASAH